MALFLLCRSSGGRISCFEWIDLKKIDNKPFFQRTRFLYMNEKLCSEYYLLHFRKPPNEEE